MTFEETLSRALGHRCSFVSRGGEVENFGIGRTSSESDWKPAVEVMVADSLISHGLVLHQRLLASAAFADVAVTFVFSQSLAEVSNFEMTCPEFPDLPFGQHWRPAIAFQFHALIPLAEIPPLTRAL